MLARGTDRREAGDAERRRNPRLHFAAKLKTGTGGPDHTDSAVQAGDLVGNDAKLYGWHDRLSRARTRFFHPDPL